MYAYVVCRPLKLLETLVLSRLLIVDLLRVPVPGVARVEWETKQLWRLAVACSMIIPLFDGSVGNGGRDGMEGPRGTPTNKQPHMQLLLSVGAICSCLEEMASAVKSATLMVMDKIEKQISLCSCQPGSVSKWLVRRR